MSWQRLADPFRIDARALAALRIGLGLMLLLDLADRVRHLRTLYGDGVYPLYHAHGAVLLPLGPHLIDARLGFQAALFAAAAVAASMLLVGYRTRIATAISWWLLISLHHRNPHIVDVGDQVLSLLLFWSVFLPLGRRWSVDARGLAPPRSAVLSPPSVGILVQVASVYLAAGLLKLHDTAWVDGSAVGKALSYDVWMRPLGEVLRAHDDWTALLTWGTLAIEIVAPLLLLSPVALRACRPIAIVALVGFQIGLGTTIQLAWIPWVMTLGLVPFVPSDVWDRIDAALARRRAQRAAGGASQEPAALPGGHVLASLALVYVVAVNLDEVAGGQFVPEAVRLTGHSLGLRQEWRMYTNPPEGGFRLGLEARLASGELREIVVDGGQRGWPDGAAFEPLESLWADYRGRMFVESAVASRDGAHVLLDWTCRRWNDGAGSEPRLVALDAHLYERESPRADPASAPGEIVRKPLARHVCSP